MILQSDNPIRMVRELKGAPLSIMMVLSLVNQRVTQEYLERATGYTDKPVSQGLAYLQEVGLADHTQAGWQLVKEKAKQLPLTLQLEEEKTPEQAEPENRTNDDALSRNNSDSLLTYLITNQDIKDINQLSKVSNVKSRKKSDLDPNIQENMETFREIGIKLNSRTEKLARMKHVTREYITGTVNNLKQGELLGLAIVRMEQGDEIPKKKHKEGCACDECIRRYGEWEK